MFYTFSPGMLAGSV